MTLKQSLAGAVAFLALASAAGAADMQPVLKAPPTAVDQQATGYVEVYTGWASTRNTFSPCLVEDGCFSGDTRLNGWALGGAGRGNYWVSRDMSVQVDAQAEGTSYDFLGGRISSHSYLVGGHWSWRNPQQYLFGLFGGIGDAGSTLGVAFSSQRHGLIGAEAQWYWQQFTLYVQGGYDTTFGRSAIESNVDLNAWFIRGTGRYFINPNFLIEGTVAYANGNVDFGFGDPSTDFQTWTWGVKGEWRLPTAPFSVFAKYQGSETKYGNSEFFDFTSAKATDHRVLLGLKLHMGDRTLQQTDRTGATLDIVSPLANPTSPLMINPAIANQL
jgi:opacity protein-like surface antigen